MDATKKHSILDRGECIGDVFNFQFPFFRTLKSADSIEVMNTCFVQGSGASQIFAQLLLQHQSLKSDLRRYLQFSIFLQWFGVITQVLIE